MMRFGSIAMRHHTSCKNRYMSTLHTTPIDKVSTSSSVVYLHGLLGNGKNLKTMATKFGAGGVLMDLRGHGQSSSGESPHSFENCAKDVLDTAAGISPVTKTVVGHSFGGRVALECAVQAPTVKSTWLLDTVPGLANDSVEKVIAAVQLVDPSGYNDRKEIAKVLQEEQQLDVGLAQWLTSSMVKSANGEGWAYGFDVNVVNDLMPEFGSQDFMGKLQHVVLSEEGEAQTVHLVRGGKNTGWTVDLISKLQNLSNRSNGRFYVHTLPKAGHWVHVDDLPGLVNLWETYQS